MTTMTSKLNELKSDVHKAAKDGNVNDLRRLMIEAMQNGDVAETVSSKTDGATPLLIACFNGHTDVVHCLVDEWAADVEQKGYIVYDPWEDITPLWIAAAENQLDVVKLLITRGADVNSVTTYKKSTPLMAACDLENQSIIKYLIDNKADMNMTDHEGVTCLMQACRGHRYDVVEYLIDRGADVNRKDPYGNTALHYCVTFSHSYSTSDSENTSPSTGSMLKVMKLLVRCKVKMEKNGDGLTPLLLAADNGKEDIVEYLIAIAEMGRTEMIEALELLGATYVDRNDMTSALKHWRVAMEERLRDGFHVMQKPVNQEQNTAYENAIEVKSMDELNNLIFDEDAMKMQALVIRERILGPGSSRTLFYVIRCGHEYGARGSFDKCLRLWTYALDMEQKFLEPLHNQLVHNLHSFTKLFSSMMRQEPHYLDFDIIMGILEKSVLELQRTENVGQDRFNRFNSVLMTTLNIIGLMCTIQESFSEEQVDKLKKTAYTFVKLNLRDSRGYTPLHFTCEGKCQESVPIRNFVFPSGDVAKILIDVGASVDARDNEYGNTPLHIAAAKSNGILKNHLLTILLEGKAHFDVCNFARETPMDLLRRTNTRLMPSFALKYQTLQCLAARFIVANSIPYKGIVSKKLEVIVDMH